MPRRLPSIISLASSRNAHGALNNTSKAKTLRPKSIITTNINKGSEVIKELGNEKGRVYVRDFARDIDDSVTVQSVTSKTVIGISFGRKINPIQDRAAERKLIIERRKQIDRLIAGGLKSVGIELDAEEKRL